MVSSPPRFTLQNVIDNAPDAFWGASGIPSAKLGVLRNIRDCGTGRFGWTEMACGDCETLSIKTRGCHDRNCPMCLGKQGREWLARQEAKLLPTPYFHVVFTLPPQLRPLALACPRIVYGALMTAAKDALLHLFGDRGDDSAIPAILAVLHTWNQRLEHHPHVHLVVSGGAYQPQTDTWVACPNPEWLVEGKVLADLFRDILMTRLDVLWRTGAFRRERSAVLDLADLQAWDDLYWPLREARFNVFIKPPFGGPRQVLRYLARYTHRTALSNRRLVRVTDTRVAFTYKNRKAGTRHVRDMDLWGFLRLYAVHIPPKGFKRIRGAGLLSGNANAKWALAKAAALRHHNGVVPGGETEEPELDPPKPPPPACCAHCGSERLTAIASYLPHARGGFKRVELALPEPKPPPDLPNAPDQEAL